MGIQLVLDNKHVRIKNAPRSVLRQVEAITSYLIAGHYFSPAFKNKRWDGKEHLLKFSDKYGYRAPSGLFVNIAKQLKRKRVKFTVVDRRRKPSSDFDFEWNEEFVLRDYQLACVEAAMKPPTPGNGLLVMPIRSGKTITAGAVIKRLGVSTVFCVTSQLLLHQTKKSFEELFQEPIGIIGDSMWEEERITVATVQSLDRARGGTRESENKKVIIPPDSRYTRLIAETDCVFFDECFPAGTMVGDRKIEEIEVGDFVDSFDEKTMKPCKKKVISTFSKPTNRLVEIYFANGKRVVCTPEHPFLTGEGWKDAVDLDSNDEVYRVVEREKDGQDSGNKMPLVWKGDFSFWTKERKVRSDGSSILFKGVLEKVRFKDFFGNDGKDEPGTCFEENEKEQSNEEARNQGKSEQDLEGNETQTANSRREWKRSYKAAGFTLGLLKRIEQRLGSGTLHVDREAERGASYELQNRHSEPEFEDSNRGEWNFSWKFEGPRSGQEKEKVFERVRVGGVVVHEREYNSRFKEVCSSGLVYNLEVEDTNTYLVDGFAVHNCHHLKGKSWHAVMQDFDAYYKLGLSATVFLKNDKECEKGAIWLQGCCGNVRFRISPSKLIREGWLMRPKIRLYKVTEPTDLLEHRWSKSLQSEAIYENEVRNELICKLAIEQVDNNKKVLIISNRMSQIEALHQKLSDYGILFATITGSVPGRKRQELIEDYVEGHYKILLGTVFGEGVDLPSVEVVINAEGGRDVKSTIQKMRNLTPKKGKKEAIYIDFVDLTNSYFANHSLERLRVYRSEDAFNVEVCEE